MRKKISVLMIAILMVLCNAFVLLPSAVQVHAAKHYQRGGTYTGSYLERITYDSKYTSGYTMAPTLPGYSGDNYKCTVIAGGIVISWYQAQYAGLIPGHTARKTVFGIETWTGQDSYVNAMFTQLYVDMGSNPEGNTIAQYLNGMNTYVNRKGFTFTGTHLINSNGSVHWNNVRAAIESNQLVTIFLSGFNVTSGITAYNGYDEVLIEKYSGNHAMAVYGYEDIQYTINGVPRIDTYLLVHTGLATPIYKIRINTECTVDAAYVTHISN